MSKENKIPHCHCCINKEDHKVIGERLEIFKFDSLVGPGLPIWLESGHIIKEQIRRYVNHVQIQNGIQMVSTPVLGRKELYELSGHWDHYQENMFPVISLNKNENYILRPMTCPHHILIYKSIPRHEKHLPIALGENSTLFRYEYSGGVTGLERTRCMELIDTHIFCTRENLLDSLQKAINIIRTVQKDFRINYEEIILAIRDDSKNKFYSDDNIWNETEKILEDFMNKEKIRFIIGKGDAAFYGPKIDFQIKTHSQKIITISTIQLDFLLPQKFELQYLKGEGGERNVPIMVHLGIIGTLERFVAYLLERDNGWLPFWLSPVQIAIIPVQNKKHLGHSIRLLKIISGMNIRSTVYDGGESMGKKIAEAVRKRVYGYIVVGDKEIKWMEELGELCSPKEILNMFKRSRNETPEYYAETNEQILDWIKTNI